MLYFVKENDKIVKYYIEYDVSKILEIRKDIIENCSFIKHFNYVTTDKKINDEHIRNLVIKPFDFKKKNEKGEILDTYHVEYDMYTYSFWVNIIDDFLNGKLEVLNDIFNEIKPKNSNEKKQVLNCIKEQANFLSGLSYNSSEYGKSIRKLQLLGEEYENICKKEQENIMQDINYHKKRLQDSISLLKVDELSFSEYEKTLNFFEREPKILYLFKKK